MRPLKLLLPILTAMAAPLAVQAADDFISIGRGTARQQCAADALVHAAGVERSRGAGGPVRTTLLSRAGPGLRLPSQGDVARAASTVAPPHGGTRGRWAARRHVAKRGRPQRPFSGKNVHDRRSASLHRGAHRHPHRQQSAGERARRRRARRHQGRRRSFRQGSQHRRHRADRRRPHLHRRRRHPRVRQAAHGRQPQRRHRHHGELPQDHRGGPARHAARRRPRDGAGRALSRVPADHARRPAGGPSRHPARRRRHAAPAAADRRQVRARRHHLRPAHPRARGQEQGHRRRHRRGRPAEGRGGACPDAGGAERAAAARARPHGDPGIARPVQGDREGDRPPRARLQGAVEHHQVRAGRRRAAVRRGHEARARAVPGAAGLARVGGAALLLLRRARGGQGARRAGRHAAARDQDVPASSAPAPWAAASP